ncbi:uncharacterized protein LOC126059211 [Elephas maximus indicus]|uniref:uncharacterized protein LOC126059211 n=1 Tax=Elephas maximus indicus TaxID=99487 RepID=UPI0021164043|nr:uncharacterized protein LOC126059211 [Elephas maximus indicus]
MPASSHNLWMEPGLSAGLLGAAQEADSGPDSSRALEVPAAQFDRGHLRSLGGAAAKPGSRCLWWSLFDGWEQAHGTATQPFRQERCPKPKTAQEPPQSTLCPINDLLKSVLRKPGTEGGQGGGAGLGLCSLLPGFGHWRRRERGPVGPESGLAGQVEGGDRGWTSVLARDLGAGCSEALVGGRSGPTFLEPSVRPWCTVHLGVQCAVRRESGDG